MQGTARNLVVSFFSLLAAACTVPSGDGGGGEINGAGASQTLYEVTGTTLAELDADADALRHIIDEQLSVLGYETAAGNVRGATRGAAVGMHVELQLAGVTFGGRELRWFGFIQQGGRLVLEDHGNGQKVLAFDFGSPIYAATGEVAGPNVDRFTVGADGQRVILSHWTSEDATGKRSIASNSAGDALTGTPDEVYAACRTALAVGPSGALTAYDGPDAVPFYARFVPS